MSSVIVCGDDEYDPDAVLVCGECVSERAVGRKVEGEGVAVSEVEGGGVRRTATLDISKLERCPLMVSCYKESIRLGNQGVGTRMVMHDTVLTDSKGQEHLLKAGVDVMWSAKRMHRMEEIWGDDPM